MPLNLRLVVGKPLIKTYFYHDVDIAKEVTRVGECVITQMIDKMHEAGFDTTSIKKGRMVIKEIEVGKSISIFVEEKNK